MPLSSATTAASYIEIPAVESQEGKGLNKGLNRMQSKIVQLLMVSYIVSMCIALPVTLFPVWLLYKAKIIDRVTKEKVSLKVGQFCSRWLMRLFPFASKRVVVDANAEQLKNPEPSIWVCNHISMLDLFFVLALDNKMRGKNRRPIKILYWKVRWCNIISPTLLMISVSFGLIPYQLT
jgi:hypothetical protein